MTQHIKICRVCFKLMRSILKTQNSLNNQERKSYMKEESMSMIEKMQRGSITESEVKELENYLDFVREKKLDNVEVLEKYLDFIREKKSENNLSFKCYKGKIVELSYCGCCNVEFSCEICSKIYNTKQSLKRHMLKHEIK